MPPPKPPKRPAFLKFLIIEVLLLAVGGSVYWWQVAHLDVTGPVPITPNVASDGAAWAFDRRLTLPRPMPVAYVDPSESASLAVTIQQSHLKPLIHGATYHLEATLTNRGNRPLRQVRFILECLSVSGERIGVDSFEALGPPQAMIEPGGSHRFTVTSGIDRRTIRVRLIVQTHDEAVAP